MSDTTISIGLDPATVLASLKAMSEETKALAKTIEDHLGKKAAGAVDDLAKKSEDGSNRITKFFSNMGQRIQSDLKAAFDFSSVLAGANFAKTLGEGVKQVYDMERAFDRLNVRMGLSSKAMADFKASAGTAVSAAGVNLQDVQPGLMAAASRGGVRDPKQMTAIAAALAQSKAINPELDTGGATEDVVEILKRQGQRVNGQNFRETLDAINSATVNGGFKSSGDAAGAITGLTPYAHQAGLDTRSMAALAAVASRAGDSGQGILQGLLKQGTQGFDQGAGINGLLGVNLFDKGKINASALSQVDTSKFGSLTPQIIERATGISGASSDDFVQFIKTFKDSQQDFAAVSTGANETATQFDQATNNWADKINMFKTRVTNAGRAIGDSIAEMANGLATGNAGHDGLRHLGSALWDNKGDLAAAGGLTLGAGLLMGGGIRGLVGGAAADAAGVQKVYVTNAQEIAGGGILDGAMGKLSGAAGFLGRSAMFLGTSSMAEIAGLGAGAVGLAGAGVAAAGVAGYGVGTGINYVTGNEGGLGGKLYDMLNPDELKTAMREGVIEGHKAVRAGLPVTNASAVKDRGANVGPR